jgi:hypothetical protein
MLKQEEKEVPLLELQGRLDGGVPGHGALCKGHLLWEEGWRPDGEGGEFRGGVHAAMQFGTDDDDDSLVAGGDEFKKANVMQGCHDECRSGVKACPGCVESGGQQDGLLRWLGFPVAICWGVWDEVWAGERASRRAKDDGNEGRAPSGGR